MVVMCWCVMPEVLYVQSFPIKGILKLFLPATGSLDRLLFTKAAPTWSSTKEHLDNQLFWQTCPLTNPLPQITKLVVISYEAGNDTTQYRRFSVYLTCSHQQQYVPTMNCLMVQLLVDNQGIWELERLLSHLYHPKSHVFFKSRLILPVLGSRKSLYFHNIHIKINHILYKSYIYYNTNWIYIPITTL